MPENLNPGSRAPTIEKFSDGQYKRHWVLPKEEIAKGYVRPVRDRYIHDTCGTVTKMGSSIAETYARDPIYYSGTFCSECGDYFPVGENGQFAWEDGEKVGT